MHDLLQAGNQSVRTGAAHTPRAVSWADASRGQRVRAMCSFLGSCRLYGCFMGVHVRLRWTGTKYQTLAYMRTFGLHLIVMKTEFCGFFCGCFFCLTSISGFKNALLPFPSSSIFSSRSMSIAAVKCRYCCSGLLATHFVHRR